MFLTFIEKGGLYYTANILGKRTKNGSGGYLIVFRRLSCCKIGVFLATGKKRAPSGFLLFSIQKT